MLYGQLREELGTEQPPTTASSPGTTVQRIAGVSTVSASRLSLSAVPSYLRHETVSGNGSFCCVEEKKVLKSKLRL